MTEIVEQVSNVTRPKLMPKRVWARTPTAKEAEIIPKLEEGYIRARALFERYDIRAKGAYDQSADPIVPDVYLKWLRTATYRYTQRNAEADVSLRPEMRVQESALADLGDMKKTPLHGEAPLTVAPHSQREKGVGRGFVTDGERVHLHHTPAYESVASDVLYNEAISVGIGDKVHNQLHAVRDSRRPYERRPHQVDGDFDFIKPHMEARGYTGREVERARGKAHDLNNDLGLYRRGK